MGPFMDQKNNFLRNFKGTKRKREKIKRAEDCTRTQARNGLQTLVLFCRVRTPM